jgi:Domain of unknown function (DUF4111)
MSGPPDVLADAATALGDALGAALLGLYAHGSWVAGDFAPDRSDLDLLAALSHQPDEAMLAVLAEVHEGLDARHPAWRGRLEVEYVGLGTVTAFAAGGTDPGGHRIARVSPGEALHLLPATTHRLLTWAGVRSGGQAWTGPPPAVLLPAVDPLVVRAAVFDHVRDWPTWVEAMRSPGGQSYAVLTLCRARHLIVEGHQVSKRLAAERARAAWPEWEGLVVWARDWWYAGGADDETARDDEVRSFVDDVTVRILASGATSDATETG